jgi:DNA-binding transcriptional ArsR family regulator
MRLRLRERLAARGAATATTLAAEVPVSRQAVVKHLAVFDEAGLASGARLGREVRYTVRPQKLGATARWMADLAAQWDRRLQATKRAAKSSEGMEPPDPRLPGG